MSQTERAVEIRAALRILQADTRALLDEQDGRKLLATLRTAAHLQRELKRLGQDVTDDAAAQPGRAVLHGGGIETRLEEV